MIYQNSISKSFYKLIDGVWHFYQPNKKIWLDLSDDQQNLIPAPPVLVLLFDLEDTNDLHS